MIKRITYLIILIISAAGCSIGRSDCVGTYVVPDNVNTIDTLILKKDGIYDRYLYNELGDLIYNNSDNWKFNDGRVLLKNFVLDEDRRYEKKPPSLSIFAMDYSLIPEKSHGRVSLFYRKDIGSHRYVQISSRSR